MLIFFNCVQKRLSRFKVRAAARTELGRCFVALVTGVFVIHSSLRGDPIADFYSQRTQALATHSFQLRCQFMHPF